MNIRLKNKPVRKTKRRTAQKIDTFNFLIVPKGIVDLHFNKRPKIGKMILGLFLICFILVSYIAIHLEIDKFSMKNAKMFEQIKSQDNKNQYDKLELEKLSSFDVIYPLVKSKYGMDHPKVEPKILLVPSNLTPNKEPF